MTGAGSPGSDLGTRLHGCHSNEVDRALPSAEDLATTITGRRSHGATSISVAYGQHHLDKVPCSFAFKPTPVHWDFDTVWKHISLGKCPTPLSIECAEPRPARQPVNMLHQVVLRPNLMFQHEEGISRVNLPYTFPPVAQQTLGAPVRLFSLTDMVLGPYGTAMWIDNHTEDAFGEAEQGQRLASKLTPPPTEARQLELSDEESSTTKARSVFLFNEEVTWSKVAIDEEEGVIAVGSVGGKISVFGYV